MPRRSSNVRLHLVFLALGTLVPILAFSSAMLVVFDRQTRSATERGLVETARALSVAVDQRVDASISALRALAATEDLRVADIEEADQTARSVLPTQPAWQNIVLYAADGRQLMNTERSVKAALPRSGNPEMIARVAATRRPAVSDLFEGQVLHRPLILVAVPVMRSDGTVRVLGASFTPRALVDVLLQPGIPSEATCSLVDRNSVLIAHTRAPTRVGQRAAPELIEQISEAGEGGLGLVAEGGASVYTAIGRSPVTGWTVALGVPRAAVDAPLRASLWLLLLVGAASTLLGAVLAALAARRIAKPIARLSSSAAALVRGEPVEFRASGLAEVDAVLEAMGTAGRERRRVQAASTALTQIGRELAATLDLAQVVNRIASAVLELFQVGRATLFQLDAAGDHLICVAAVGSGESAEWIGQRLARGQAVSGRALADLRRVSVPDVRSDREIVFPEWMRGRIGEDRYGGVTSVPLIARGRALGALSLAYEAGRSLSEDELRLLDAFADQAAVALENARLFQESERRRRTAEGLHEVGRLISESLDSRDVAQRIMDSTRTLLSASLCILYRLVPETGELVALAAAGTQGSGLDRDFVVPAGVGAAGLAVRERRGVVTADVLDDPRIMMTTAFRKVIEAARYRAVLAVPLMVNGRVIGALGVGDGAGRRFEADDVRIAQAFADQAAIAMENARLHEEVRERLSQSETLLAVSRQVSGTLDVAETMRRVAREAGRALGADMVGAFLADPDHAALHAIAGYHVPRELLDEFTASPIPLEAHRMLAEAWRQRRPIESSDVAAIPGTDRDVFARLSHRSSLFCPMIVHGEPIGGLIITWREQGRRLTPTERRLAEGISRQAGIALSNGRLVEELKTRQARLEALLGVEHQLSRIQPVESLLGQMAAACGRLFSASSVAFHRVDGDRLVLCGSGGEPTADLTPANLKIGEGLTGIAAATGEPVVVHDPAGDPRLAAPQRDAYLRAGVRAFLGAPVKAGDQVLGVLTVRTRRKEGFTAADVEMARAFASQAAIALENSRLYQEVQRAFDELSRTQQQLTQSQKMEAIGSLSGGIAHDFNNLLTVITGRSFLLLTMGKLPEAARRDVEIIQQTAERAAALTHQLLAFSRKQVLQPKPLDVNALVGGLAPMLARLIGEHIQLVISPGSRPGSVLADPGQLEQVVVNLVVNARDAMPGGGTLEIETGSRDLPSEVQHGLGRIPPGRYVTLAVQDTGSGMSAATLSRIFEPFFTTKDPGKGTGLGLSTVYGIVHQSGGHIGVDSREGAGTTFTIYLSRTEDAPEQATAGDRAALASGRGAVLVAEDDDAVRQLASQVLAACGYTVLESGDPREALAIAERYAEPIDLLLTDIVMPGMRGPSLAAQVLARHRETRVLYMSGYTDEMIASHGALSPPGTFLQKPFTPDVLATAVRGSLDARPLAPR